MIIKGWGFTLTVKKRKGMFIHKYYEDPKVGGADWDDLPKDVLDKMKKVYDLPIMQVKAYGTVKVVAYSEEEAWEKFNQKNDEDYFEELFDFSSMHPHITEDHSAEVKFQYADHLSKEDIETINLEGDEELIT
jgi:hypothetical protein